MSDFRRRIAALALWLEARPWLLPVVILLAGAGFRFYNLNWDSGYDLHPDERWIFMVISGAHGNPPSPALQWPGSISQFFNIDATTRSPLDPHFFAYGSLPFYVMGLVSGAVSLLGQHVPLFSQWADADTYGGLPMLARGLSAALDLSGVFLLFLLGKRVYGYWTGVLAMTLAAFTVLDVQLSHFFAVDTVLLPLVLLTLLGAVEIVETGSARGYLLTGIAFGAAMATKTTGLLLLAPITAAAVLSAWPQAPSLGRRLWDDVRSIYARNCVPLNRALQWLLATLALGAVAFAVFEPYGLLDRQTLLHDISDQNTFLVTNDPPFSVPFTIQYAHTTPYLYQLKNLLFWGMGIPLGLAAFLGTLYVLWRCLRLRASRAEAVLILWVIPYFLFVGRFFAKFDRYMLPITGVMTLFGAALLVALVRRLRGHGREVAWAALATVTAVSFLYSLAYMNIYEHLNTRVAATHWMYSHIRPGTTIALEGAWDDALPLPEPGKDPSMYRTINLNLYDGETAPGDQQNKIAHITDALQHADYLIMTSERMIGSIPKLPERYPITVRYYKLLFSNGLNFRLEREFQQHPQLGPIVVHDYPADESFHVYDHPLVRIFKRIAPITAAQVKHLLTTGIPVVANPTDPAAATIIRPVIPPPDTRLILTPKQWAADQAGPTMDSMFPADSPGMQHPLLVWLILLELLGLLAVPFTFLLFHNLTDRGMVIGKTIGLLIFGYLVWMGVNLGVGQYNWALIAIAFFVFAAASALLAYRLQQPLVAFVQARWRTILAGELVFLAAFAIVTVLRMVYPDLGHQFSPAATGNIGGGQMGEKQMELAYLNAIVRSRVFPPYDPFFAHGYINYYYYGLFLVGTLCKLTRIMPSTGFNLAVATFFALLASNCFSVVLNLTRKLAPALAAVLFVGLIGNLNGGWQLLRGLMGVATIHNDAPVIGGLQDIISGLEQVVVAHAQLPPISYWEARSLFPSAINEFPYFTYLFADLHPHLMAYPMTVAAVAVGVNLLRGGYYRALWAASALILAGLLLGAIAATNPWDFPMYLGIVGIGAFLGSYLTDRRLRIAHLRPTVLWLVGTAAASYVLYLPFKRSYQTVFETGIGLVRNVPIDAVRRDVCGPGVTDCAAAVHDTLVTPLRLYLEHFGFFAFILASYLVLLLLRDAGLTRRLQRNGTALRFALYYREHLGRLPRVFRVVRRMRRARNNETDPSLLLGFLILVAGLLALGYYLLAFLSCEMALLALVLAALARRLRGEELFVLGLVTLGVLVSITTQIVFVKDFLAGGASFRMNTIFKFYDEVWVLFALASASSLYFLFVRERDDLVLEEAQTARSSTSPASTPAVDVPSLDDTAAEAPALQTAPSIAPLPVAVGAEPERVVHPPHWQTASPAAVPSTAVEANGHAPARTAAEEPPNGWRALLRVVERRSLWSLAFIVLLFGSLVYTYGGTINRETMRQSWLPQHSVPLTLDGMAFMKVAYPDEYAAIGWLNAHVHGSQVVTEAPGAYYDWRSRVSMFTGLPSIINGIHEGEQRFGDEIDPTALCNNESRDPATCTRTLHSRADDANALYNAPDEATAWRVIRTYGVRYIFVGFVERQCVPSAAQCFSKAGLAKFPRMVGHGLRVAFRRGDVTVYQVVRG